MLRAYIAYQGIKNRVTSYFKEDSGATAIEYGLIAGGIAVAIIAVVYGVGTDLKDLFTDVQTELNKRPATGG